MKRGNNRENLFYNADNYGYFLRKYDEIMDDVLETHAFCLLPNHFHLVVRTKKFHQAGETSKMNPVSYAFQRLFTGYTNAINKQQNRSGSLFLKPFKRLEVKTTRQLANLVHYVHINPQKHGICDDFRYYPWSSYERIIKSRPTKLKKDEVLSWFKNEGYYVNYHSKEPDLDEIRDLIIE